MFVLLLHEPVLLCTVAGRNSCSNKCRFKSRLGQWKEAEVEKFASSLMATSLIQSCWVCELAHAGLRILLFTARSE